MGIRGIRKKSVIFSLVICVIACSAANVAAITDEQNIADVMGGGNFVNGTVDGEQVKYNVYNEMGVKMARMALYPAWYWSNGKPTPERSDNAMRLAHKNGITPTIQFEFTDYPQSLGDYQKWYDIGFAYAERFKPNGSWAKANGVKDWGVTIFSALNEVDNDGHDRRAPFDEYYSALEGLADGIHASDESLKVINGAFCHPCAHRDWTAGGYALVIAELFNNGKLDGLNLHTYYDVEWAPMENSYQASVQYSFDQVKKTAGITRDINYYATEFNYKKRNVSEEQAARGFLTGIWDNVGVVKNDGTSATVIAFPWNLTNLAERDYHYALTVQLEPWIGDPRGYVLQMVLQLTDGMRFTKLDPKETGTYELEGDGKKMWVWQNRVAWTNMLGNSFNLTDIPPGTSKVDVYGWDGIRDTIEIKGERRLKVRNLNTDETYMFIAYVDGPVLPEPPYEDEEDDEEEEIVFTNDTGGIMVVLDSKKIRFDVLPESIDGRTMVPIRAIFEAFGAAVAWDPVTQTITASKQPTTLELILDSNIALVNGKEVELDVPAQIKNDRTFVPLRFISEVLNGEVTWDEEHQTVNIKTPKKADASESNTE